MEGDRLNGARSGTGELECPFDLVAILRRELRKYHKCMYLPLFIVRIEVPAVWHITPWRYLRKVDLLSGSIGLPILDSGITLVLDFLRNCFAFR